MKSQKFSLTQLPDKRYFRIGEVCKYLRLPAHTLRYWETEFAELAPQKTSSGQRIYTKPEIELLAQIKRLLYEEKFTIAGAKNYLKQSRKLGPNQPSSQSFSSKKETQLGFGFEQKALEDKLKKTVKKLKEIEALLGSE